MRFTVPTRRFSRRTPEESAMPLMHRKTMFRRTARRPWWCAALLCLAVLAGCEDVEERVWWAPDGSVAAVDGRPGLRLMQPDGTLTEPILDGTVAGVSWLPDGSGLVVARAISVATWDEAKALLPAEESQAIEAAAGMVPSCRRPCAPNPLRRPSTAMREDAIASRPMRGGQKHGAICRIPRCLSGS